MIKKWIDLLSQTTTRQTPNTDDSQGERRAQSAQSASSALETREKSRSPRAQSSVHKYMEDSKEFYKAYKKREGNAASTSSQNCCAPSTSIL